MNSIVLLLNKDVMDKKILKALKGSIKKWEDISSGTGVDKAAGNCPLCQLCGEFEEGCYNCLVYIKVDRIHCEATPYIEWRNHVAEHLFSKEEDHFNSDGTYSHDYKVYCEECAALADKELEFLKSLLP